MSPKHSLSNWLWKDQRGAEGAGLSALIDSRAPLRTWALISPPLGFHVLWGFCCRCVQQHLLTNYVLENLSNFELLMAPSAIEDYGLSVITCKLSVAELTCMPESASKKAVFRDGATLMVLGLTGNLQNHKQAQMEFCGLYLRFLWWFCGNISESLRNGHKLGRMCKTELKNKRQCKGCISIKHKYWWKCLL